MIHQIFLMSQSLSLSILSQFKSIWVEMVRFIIVLQGYTTSEQKYVFHGLFTISLSMLPETFPFLSLQADNAFHHWTLGVRLDILTSKKTRILGVFSQSQNQNHFSHSEIIGDFCCCCCSFTHCTGYSSLKKLKLLFPGLKSIKIKKVAMRFQVQIILDPKISLDKNLATYIKKQQLLNSSPTFTSFRMRSLISIQSDSG